MFRIHFDNKGCGCSFSLFNIVAAVVSWMKWHSIGWAIVHGICGIFYLIYLFILYIGQLWSPMFH